MFKTQRIGHGLWCKSLVFVRRTYNCLRNQFSVVTKVNFRCLNLLNCLRHNYDCRANIEFIYRKTSNGINPVVNARVTLSQNCHQMPIRIWNFEFRAKMPPNFKILELFRTDWGRSSEAGLLYGHADNHDTCMWNAWATQIRLSSSTPWSHLNFIVLYDTMTTRRHCDCFT